MTKDVQDAVYILGKAASEVALDGEPLGMLEMLSWQTLNHAIRHLAYPDRDIYPKTRKGTKGAPIVRR